MAEPTPQTTPVTAALEETDAQKTIDNTKNDPRFVRGLALQKEKRYEEAITLYGDLLQTMIEVEQQSETLTVAPVYYEYGNTLLKQAEATASVFGNGADQDDGDVEQEANETADDLQVAWEMLEIARVIYTRYPEELAVEKELARVYMRLGDHGMESEAFERAKNDYEKSLMLRKKVLKLTKDPDTTLIADLYCMLAISCIYHDSSLAEQTPADKIQASLEREQQGMKYYVLAGRVMAENIYRVAADCPAQLMEFIQQRVPKYSGAEDESEAPSKGKGKQKAASTTLDLEYKMDNMASLREDFLTCVQAYKSLAGDAKAGTTTQDDLTKAEAELLEFLEIYVELKEKVDAIKESVNAEIVGNATATQEEGTTTIGFGAPSTTAPPAPTSTTESAPAVNVLPVVKKRKIQPQAVDLTTEEKK